jgi:hypothetical protein
MAHHREPPRRESAATELTRLERAATELTSRDFAATELARRESIASKLARRESTEPELARRDSTEPELAEGELPRAKNREWWYSSAGHAGTPWGRAASQSRHFDSNSWDSRLDLDSSSTSTLYKNMRTIYSGTLKT